MITKDMLYCERCATRTKHRQGRCVYCTELGRAPELKQPKKHTLTLRQVRTMWLSGERTVNTNRKKGTG